jgi:PAS domain S-box-containing protein
MKEEEPINDLARSRQENTELSEEARVKAVSAVVDAMGDALLLHSLDGKILFVNPAYEKMTGYDRSELVGKDVGKPPVPSPFRL